jgi:hypothetical protein
MKPREFFSTPYVQKGHSYLAYYADEVKLFDFDQ